MSYDQLGTTFKMIAVYKRIYIKKRDLHFACVLKVSCVCSVVGDGAGFLDLEGIMTGDRQTETKQELSGHVSLSLN